MERGIHATVKLVLVTYWSTGLIRFGGVVIFVLFTLYVFITGGNVNSDGNEIFLTETSSRSKCICNNSNETKANGRNTKQTIYHTDGFELYLYSAYYDARFNDYNIRIFGVENKVGVSKNFTCRWSEHHNGVTVLREVRARKIRVDNGWPNITSHYATEIDCQVPQGIFVDVIDVGPYGQEYRIQVPVNYYKEQQKKTIAVCVKPVTGKLDVSKLVEWFEMFRLAGIDNFIIYDTDVMGNAKFVFDFYEQMGILDLVPFPFVMALLDHVDGPQMRPVDRYGVYQQSFLVAMQDCFYKYQHHYEYLLFIDLDEVLLPTSDISIPHLARTVHEQFPEAAAFMFLTAWHFDDMNAEIEDKHGSQQLSLRHSDTGASVFRNRQSTYMQKHSRATLPLDIQPKSIVYPPHTVTVNFHGAHDVPDIRHGNVRILNYDKYGYIHHFRGPCMSKFDKKACEKLKANTRVDGNIVRYRDQISGKVQGILQLLQMK